MGGELLDDECKKRFRSKGKEKEEERVDWSTLDANILDLIVDQLTINIADFVCFHGVCKTWHASDSYDLTHPPQLPWLLLRCDYSINRLIFYSFADERIHSIQVSTDDRHIIGSCEDDEWTLVDDTSKFHDVIYFKGSFYAVDETAQ
ncbi:unnamed protein product, partial [Musa acuminata subsp. burmannicoides]